MTNAALITQIEYYLSEDNLQNDEFFYKQVAANKYCFQIVRDHYVGLKCFLNCNKIKKLGVTKTEQIVEALTGCQTLQLNAAKTMLRKVDLLQLPQFKPKKKLKSQQKVKQHIQNPYDKLEVYTLMQYRVVFSLSVEKQQMVPFRYVQQALLKNHNIYSPYVRFNKTEGNFAIDKKNYKEEVFEKLVVQGLKVGDTVLTVSKAQGDKLAEFWEKHGHHYKGIIENLRKDFSKRAKEQKRTQQRSKKVQKFEFAGEIYDDINKLKSLFKNILCRNPNNIPLQQKQDQLVTELLQYHQKGGAKLANKKHYVVDVHPNFSDTRCLFVVKEDGTREDFSILKCINKIEEKFSV